MADTKISAATNTTPPLSTDMLPLARSGDTTARKITVGNFLGTIPALVNHVPAAATTFRSLTFSQVDANCRNWNENIATWVNSGGGNNNNTWQMGYNNAVGGGGVDATEPSFYIQMESNYNPTGGAPKTPTFEYHLNVYEAGSALAVRPFQYNAARDGTWVEAFYNADKTGWFSRTGTQWMTLDAGVMSLLTAGLQVLANNVVALKQYNAAANALWTIAYINSGNIMELGDSRMAAIYVPNTPLRVAGYLQHEGTRAGFYGTTPIVKQTGVAVTAGGIHAALVALGLIAA